MFYECRLDILFNSKIQSSSNLLQVKDDGRSISQGHLVGAGGGVWLFFFSLSYLFFSLSLVDGSIKTETQDNQTNNRRLCRVLEYITMPIHLHAPAN